MSSSLFLRLFPVPADGEGSKTDGAQGIPTVLEHHAADEILLLSIQRGDETAFGTFFDRYADLVYRLGLYILHDTSEAQELVQDVFLHVYRKSRSFDPRKGPARSWLIQHTYGRAFDRRRYLNARHFYDNTDFDGCGQIEATTDLERESEFAWWISALRSLFRELSERQRQTLELVFFEGYSLREISKHFNEPLRNTRHHYYRGLERLRAAANMVRRGARVTSA